MPKKLKAWVPPHKRKTAPMRVGTYNPVYLSKQYRAARAAALVRDEFTCKICGAELRGFDCTVDHIVPLAQGGDPFSMSNLQAACRSCNSAKGKQTGGR